jgi:hypothetical protein
MIIFWGLSWKNRGRLTRKLCQNQDWLNLLKFKSLWIGDNSINSIDKAKNLGFWFDSRMKMVTSVQACKCSSAVFLTFLTLDG